MNAVKEMKSLSEIKGDLKKVVDTGVDKIEELVAEFNSASPAFEAAGFSVANFKVDVASPEVAVTIVGDITAVDVNALQTYIDENPDKKLMTVVLSGVKKGFQFQEKITQLGMRYVIGNLSLSLQPSIGVEFVKNLPA